MSIHSVYQASQQVDEGPTLSAREDAHKAQGKFSGVHNARQDISTLPQSSDPAARHSDGISRRRLLLSFNTRPILVLRCSWSEMPVPQPR